MKQARQGRRDGTRSAPGNPIRRLVVTALMVGGLALARGLAPDLAWGSTPAAQGGAPASPAASQVDLRPGRILLQAKQFSSAKQYFESALRSHPGEVQAELGLGDAELGLRQYEQAEASYRAAVARQPELWQAHKNLVIVEAALGRWEEFDGERTVLRLARERGSPGINPRESDIIDSFDIGPAHWVVRAYFEPLGRSQTVYNFERFSPSGRVEAYISLENAAAAQAALHPSDLRIGTPAAGTADASSEDAGTLALNWYTGASHGTIARYPHGKPTYEHVRAAVLAYLRTHTLTAPLGTR